MSTHPATALHPLRRMSSMVRAETLLLFRNKTVLLNALLLAPLMAIALSPMLQEAFGTGSLAALLLQMLMIFGLMFVIYYNITAIVVARREAGIFQRMKTGQTSEWEALISAAIPSAFVLSIQILMGVLASSLIARSLVIVNPLPLIIATLGGILIFGGLAAWTSSWSSTVESAQYSTMPVMMAALFFSGYFLPVNLMPETLQTVSSYSPLYAVNALVTISMGASPALDGGAPLTLAETFTALLTPTLTVLVWVGISLLAARKTRFARRA